jgi:hypothetical protein
VSSVGAFGERVDLLVPVRLEQAQGPGLPVSGRETYSVVADPAGMDFELGKGQRLLAGEPSEPGPCKGIKALGLKFSDQYYQGDRHIEGHNAHFTRRHSATSKIQWCDPRLEKSVLGPPAPRT